MMGVQLALLLADDVSLLVSSSFLALASVEIKFPARSANYSFVMIKSLLSWQLWIAMTEYR
jgi:hypothetical protein